MKFVRPALLAVCLAFMPGANGFATDSLPFKVLSMSINPPAKRRALPQFSLMERSGKRITLADLRGKVWIADFIYTHCADTCPLQTADMAKLQDLWMNESSVKLVSFSVDPEHDTPVVLSRYGERFRADPNRWLFLTGDKREIVHLVEDGFHLGVTLASSSHHGSSIIIHSPRFVLIDREGEIRGYYDNRDPQSMRRLKGDVAKLLRR